MCISAIMAGVGALASSRSANKAAKAQTAAASNEIAFAKETRDLVRADLAPYNNTGAINALNFEMGLGDRPEGYGGFQASEGYNFAFDEGQRALEGSAAAQGGLNSGRFLKATSDYGQGMANQEYGNYFNRLMGLSANAQQAAAGQGAAATNASLQVGNAYGSIGNAQAAGAIAQGNAFSGLMSNLSGLYGYQKANNAPTQNAFSSGQTW